MTAKPATPSFSSTTRAALQPCAMSRPCRAAQPWPRTLPVSTRCALARRFPERRSARLRFVLVATEIAHGAFRTKRLSRHADIAPMQDQPVMRMLRVCVGHDLHQRILDLARRAARRQSPAIGEPANMPIDGYRLFAEDYIENDVC